MPRWPSITVHSKMGKNNKKVAGNSSAKPGKEVSGTKEKEEQTNNAKFRWRSDWIDIDADFEWNFRSIECDKLWREVLPRLHDLETQTWGEVYGKRDGSTHPMPVDRIAKTAQDRLKALGREDYDSIFQINIRGGIRIWGIRDRSVFYLMWFDPNHTVYEQRGSR